MDCCASSQDQEFRDAIRSGPHHCVLSGFLPQACGNCAVDAQSQEALFGGPACVLASAATFAFENKGAARAEPLSQPLMGGLVESVALQGAFRIEGGDEECAVAPRVRIERLQFRRDLTDPQDEWALRGSDGIVRALIGGDFRRVDCGQEKTLRRNSEEG